MEISVVVIARNEERRIAACLESASAALRGHAHELIVVDSNSTDGTVEVALRHPATVVRLGGSRPITPAAGRHAGLTLARAPLVLFLDGDSVLDARWVAPALEAIRDERTAGVAGMREAVVRQPGSDRIVGRHPFPQDVAPEPELRFLGGSALYRATVLREVGGFNPFVFACEEAELGARICARGYRLRRLPIRMTEHLTEARAETLGELRRRMRRGYPYGMGQLVRHGLAHGTLATDHLRAIVRPLAVALALVVGAGCVALRLALGWRWPLVAWIAAAAGALLVFRIRSGSFRRSLYYVVEWALTGVMILRGLLMRPRGAADYPLRLDVVRRRAEEVA